MSEIIQSSALNLIHQGVSVIPIKEKKYPDGDWKKYTQNIMDESDVPKKFNGTDRYAVIGGEVSGNLECLDIDDPATYEPILAMIRAKHPDIFKKVIIAATPNGYGIIYRAVGGVSGSLKLAKSWTEVEGPGEYTWDGRPNDPKKYKAKEYNGKWYISATRLETRGEGGYFLLHPTPGYDILDGSFKEISPISEIERNSILTIAKSFDERPAELRPADTGTKEFDVKPRIPYPGDIFNKETNMEDLLQEFGWSKVGKVRNGVGYSRPGVEKGRISATLYNDGRLHVFSSNADPLEEGKQYTAFALLTLYKHDGDFSESTKALADSGYHVELDDKELRDILKENPDELEEAYKRSGMSEAEVTSVALSLNIPLPDGKRPNRVEVVYDKLNLNKVVKEMDQALSTICGDWGYFKYSGLLGYVTQDNTFTGYTPESLELRIEQSMFMTQWTKPNGGGRTRLEPIRVHKHCVNMLMGYPDSTAPQIRGFAQHPLIDRTGEVVGLRDGFENGIMFSKCSGLNIKIDDRSYEECYDRIVEIFCGDILFKDKEGGQALFVSMLLTALCRLGIDGGCPGYFITANEPGTGKSTLFEFVSRTVYGRVVESVDWGEETVERRKEVISVLREGVECLLFDNIEQGIEIKSPILAQAITAGELKGRILGKSEAISIRAQSLFVFIGNNLKMSTELARRLMTIDLLSPRQNPAQRDVQINDIAAYCERHRAEVIGCLLKMAKESFSMDNELDKSSGFTFWDKVVRNPVYVKKGIDVVRGFEKSQEDSGESEDVETLIHALTMVFGTGVTNSFTAKDVYLAIADERYLSDPEIKRMGQIRHNLEMECIELRDIMQNINAKSTVMIKSTGKVLSMMKDRVVGDIRFVRHTTKSKQPVKHWLEVTTEE